MQYHFVVHFDEYDKRWHIMATTDHLMPDGSIYNPDNEEYGWFIPAPTDAAVQRDASLFQDLREMIGAVIEP